MTNKDKFIEVFGFEPDTETMIPVCPPRGVECPFMDDGIYSECHCELWWGREYKEPTTKNDLGVDCISREQALVAIRNLYPSMPRVDFNGSLRKWVDKYKPYIECDDAIKQLPSVTTQPTKNDLGVDLISRADAIQAMQDKAKKLTNEDTINGLCGAVAILFDLPSITPQEPRGESEGV